MEGVPGVVLDESFLISGDGHLVPGAETLLRRLHYSKLCVGISYCNKDTSSQKVSLLKNVAMQLAFDFIAISSSNSDDCPCENLLSWGSTGGTYYYATVKRDDSLFVKLRDLGWTIIVKSSENDVKVRRGELHINMTEQLLHNVCQHIKLSSKGSSVITIGYVMKPSREQDFAKRGAFPMCPTQNGIMFVPIMFDVPLASQMQSIDVVLHKATDEIINVDPCNFEKNSKGVTFSRNMLELQRYVEDQPECCIIDPISNIYPLLDRLQIQEILLGLEDISTKNCNKIRAPHFLQVENFNEPNLEKQLAKAKLVFPNIVKARIACGVADAHSMFIQLAKAKLIFPNVVKERVACGVADAHSMAIVFKFEDFTDLRVPLPAVIQEYIDHGSSLYKFYVLGEKVFYATRKSIPNANVLLSSSGEDKCHPIIFDSLKSLPTAKETQITGCEFSSDSLTHSLDVGLVTDAAHWLRRRLDLTILGFDVVIQENTGDHVIVDINYLPSFKEIPDEAAVPAFWDALKSRYLKWKAK